MNTRKYSKKQETDIAKKLGAKRQANSGATPFYKGDVVSNKFLIEAKTATIEKQSVSIKKEWLIKMQEEAFSMGKPYAALAFNYGGLRNAENFYIINENLFKILKERLENE